MRCGEVGGYCPNSGDIIWRDFLQPVGNEQAGRRPALVLSPRAFNELTGRCIACPITSRDRDWSFHVAIPDGHEVGVSCRPTNCAVPLGSNAARDLYAKPQPVWLTMCEQSSKRCSSSRPANPE